MDSLPHQIFRQSQEVKHTDSSFVHASAKGKKRMGFQKDDLDVVLVPAGLLIMFVYHIHLLYRYLYSPHTTFMGYENNDKEGWVEAIMKDKDISVALSVTSTNTSAAIYLATISLTLCSLIGAWIANSSNNLFQSNIIYGDTRSSTMSIKYISLLVCFLLAFSCFVQSARHLVHGSYLISNPSGKVPVSSVKLAIIRGGELWSLGLRALYFALNLLLWFFGPVPMCIASIVMVVILSYLDSNSYPFHDYELVESKTVKKTTKQSV